LGLKFELSTGLRLFSASDSCFRRYGKIQPNCFSRDKLETVTILTTCGKFDPDVFYRVEVAMMIRSFWFASLFLTELRIT